MKEDSIEGIYETLKTCALISKTAGGKENCKSIRQKGLDSTSTKLELPVVTLLEPTAIQTESSQCKTKNNTKSYKRLRVFNNTARYVDQGGNKRPGAFAMYLEPWHADVFDFLDLKKNTGKEESRARDLFYAMWIPDLFMKRVEDNGDWSLFCPAEAPGMDDVWGKEFEDLYAHYEEKGN